MKDLIEDHKNEKFKNNENKMLEVTLLRSKTLEMFRKNELNSVDILLITVICLIWQKK